jgi:hypothetical protein
VRRLQYLLNLGNMHIEYRGEEIIDDVTDAQLEGQTSCLPDEIHGLAAGALASGLAMARRRSQEEAIS